MRTLLLAFLPLATACSSQPSATPTPAPERMTIDALTWAHTRSDSRFYLEAHLVECESATELKAFTSAADQHFHLVSRGEDPILLSCGTGGRTVKRGDHSSCSLMLFPVNHNWRPTPGHSYDLIPVNRDDDHQWVLAPGLEPIVGE